MYYLYIDHGTENETLVWQGPHLAVGSQMFNKEKNASEKGDWDVLELFRVDELGNRRVEKTFRFPA